ncbi:MAG: protein kinase family protein [Oligoflexia bacterium]|nr:protein kinase family protein [Oligoflexia bacterium]
MNFSVHKYRSSLSTMIILLFFGFLEPNRSFAASADPVPVPTPLSNEYFANLFGSCDSKYERLLCHLCESAVFFVAEHGGRYDRCLQKYHIEETCSPQNKLLRPISISKGEKIVDAFKRAIENYGRKKRLNPKDVAMYWTKIIEYTLFPNTFPSNRVVVLKEGNNYHSVSLLKTRTSFIFDTGEWAALPGTNKQVTKGIAIIGGHSQTEMTETMRETLVAVLHLKTGENHSEQYNRITRDSVQKEYDALMSINKSGPSRGIAAPMGKINQDLYFQRYYPEGDFYKWQSLTGRKLSDKMIYSLLLGLWQIHQTGIAHLDISASNVMIDGDSAIITDLGNSRRLNEVVNINPGDTTTADYIDPHAALLCKTTRVAMDVKRSFPNFTNFEEAKAADGYALGLVILQSETPHFGKRVAELNACFNAVCSPHDKYRNPRKLCKNVLLASMKPDFNYHQMIKFHNTLLASELNVNVALIHEAF